MTTNKKQRLTLFINPIILKHAKVQAIVEEITLTALIEKLLLSYLPEEIVVKNPQNR